MLSIKLLSVCIATVVVIGLPLSVSPQTFASNSIDTELNGFRLNGFRLNGFRLNGFRVNGFRVNGFRLNGLRFNGAQSTTISLVDSSVQSMRVEGGQLVIQAEIGQ